MKTKFIYEAPTSRIYEVRTESVMQSTSPYGNEGEAGGDLGGGSEYDL